MRFDSYGNYSVLIGGEEWLRSAPTSFTLLGRTYSTHDDSLKLLKRASENGTDTLGPWNAVNFYYRPSYVLVTIKVSIKFYIRESCVVFSQVMLSSDILVTIKVSVNFYIRESCVIFSQVKNCCPCTCVVISCLALYHIERFSLTFIIAY